MFGVFCLITIEYYSPKYTIKTGRDIKAALSGVGVVEPLRDLWKTDRGCLLYTRLIPGAQ